jgi:hypothetical protein
MLVFDQLASTVVFYDGLGDKVVAHVALPTLFTARLEECRGVIGYKRMSRGAGVASS